MGPNVASVELNHTTLYKLTVSLTTTLLALPLYTKPIYLKRGINFDTLPLIVFFCYGLPAGFSLTCLYPDDMF